MSEATRIAALAAAIDFRSGQMRPDEVIELARQFDAYLADPPRPPKKAPPRTSAAGAPGARA